MSEAPHIENVHYDREAPLVDSEQIDMLFGDPETGLDTTLMRELFELFQTELTSKLDTLTDLCAKGDVDALRQVVHFIAGSAGNLGLARLCAFCRGIEGAIDDRSLVSIADCEKPIREAFAESCEAFRQELDI